MNSDLPDFSQNLRFLISRFMSTRGWGDHIEDWDEFLQLVQQNIEKRQSVSIKKESEIIVDAIVHTYAQSLYNACRENNTMRQQIALREVSNYIQKMLWNLKGIYSSPLTSEEVEELSQEIIIQSWERLAQLKDPGMFFAWLRTLTWRRFKDTNIQSTKIEGKEVSVSITALKNVSAPNGSHTLLNDELAKVIATCLGNSRRADIVIAYYLKGWSASEISAKFGITPKNFSMLKARSLDQLRNCQPLTEFFERLKQEG